MALSQTSVLKLYNTVIDDVINGVRDSFIDEGVDEQVLQELKQIWENKLMASKAVEVNSETPEPQPPQIQPYTKPTSKGGSKRSNAAKQQQQQQQQQQDQREQSQPIPEPPITQPSKTQPVPPAQMMNQIQPPPQQAQIPPHLQPQQQIQQHRHPLQQQQHTMQNMQPISSVPPGAMHQPPQGNMNAAASSAMPDRQISIQIKLPQHQNLPERLITVHVPSSAIQGNQLHSIFSGPVITAAIGLPAPIATSLLQQHINQTFEGQPGFTPVPVSHPVQVVTQPTANMVQPQMLQGQPQGNIAQLDGAAGDTSDEDDDDDDDDDNEDEDEDAEDKDEEENDDAAAREEEPLNSEDDVTDDDPTDLFDTDNVVVCQYDKITRSRNKWKFYLKDGIMNLSGKDFVFQKANGDAEW